MVCFFKWGLDFAGHILSAGWAACRTIFMEKKEKFKKVNQQEITVLKGTGFTVVWLVWFNAGSTLGSNGLAVQEH
jgi:Amt family ammonium transporter